jgi:hypothetical protein
MRSAASRCLGSAEISGAHERRDLPGMTRHHGGDQCGFRHVRFAPASGRGETRVSTKSKLTVMIPSARALGALANHAARPAILAAAIRRHPFKASADV